MNASLPVQFVSVKLLEGRYVVFKPNGQRLDSRKTEASAKKLARRLFPSYKVKMS